MQGPLRKVPSPRISHIGQGSRVIKRWFSLLCGPCHLVDCRSEGPAHHALLADTYLGLYLVSRMNELGAVPSGFWVLGPLQDVHLHRGWMTIVPTDSGSPTMSLAHAARCPSRVCSSWTPSDQFRKTRDVWHWSRASGTFKHTQIVVSTTQQGFQI